MSTTDQTGTTTAVYDQLDRPTMVTPPLPQAPLTYGYTPDPGNQRWITTVTANGIGSYQYQEDTKGRLSDLVNPFSQTFHLEYDRDGKNTLLTQPNGVQELRSYTVRDWLSGIQIKEQNTSVLDTFNYYYTDGNGVYDPTGHLQREVDGANKTHAFFYDRLYELVQETHPDFGSIGYGYDLNGNRTSKTTSAGTDYYGVDAANKLLWVNRGTNAPPTHLQANPYTLFTYDACGRTTYRERQFDGGWHRDFSFLWDGDDRLRSVKNWNDAWLSASYAGDGTRVSKTDFFTGTHNYSWGPGGLLADSSGSTTYTPGFSQRQGTTDRFFHTDWLGSTRYLSDGTGNSFPKTVRYSAFGERTFNIGSDPDDFAPFQFAGGAGYQSEHATATEPGVGLQLLGERYYDPSVGRFISPDPIRFGGGLNLYGYVDNDPTNGLDPSGLVLTPFDWVILGYDAVHLGYSVYRGDWRGAAVDTGILALDGLLTTIPGAPPAAGGTRLALIFAEVGARPAAEAVEQLALGALLRSVYYASSAAQEGCPRGGSGPKPSIRSKLKEAGPSNAELPSRGKVRFVPAEGYDPRNDLRRGPNHGYLDRFGNEWTWDELHGDHWDVRLSGKGKAQLGWASRSGVHLNVTPDGRVLR